MASVRMHPIFKRLTLFLLVMTAVNAGITWYFYNVSISNHKLLKQDRRFHRAPDDIDVLIMGHSRPAAALHDSLLPSAVNFCSGGESNIHTFYKLKYVLEKSGKDVKTVVLPAGFGSFGLPDATVNANSFYWKRYVDYLKLGQEAGQFTTYLGVWLKAHLVPWYEYPYLRLSVAFGDFDLTVNKEAYAAATDAERLETTRKVIAQQMSTKTYYDSVSINYLQQTIELCGAHDVELIYVKFPVSSYYKTIAAEVAQAEEFEAKIALVDSMINHSETAILWDLTGEPSFQDNTLFSDPQHMTKAARRIFTTKFAQLLTAKPIRK